MCVGLWGAASTLLAFGYPLTPKVPCQKVKFKQLWFWVGREFILCRNLHPCLERKKNNPFISVSHTLGCERVTAEFNNFLKIAVENHFLLSRCSSVGGRPQHKVGAGEKEADL